MSSSVADGDTGGNTGWRNGERKKEKKKERAAWYKRARKCRKLWQLWEGEEETSRCATAREMKSGTGETIVYKFDRWNFSFHPFLCSLYFFPPAWNYGSFDKWAPYDPIKTREKWRKRTFHLIFGNVIKGNKNLAVHSIISNSVCLLFSVFFPLLTRSRTISPVLCQ